MSQEPHMHDEEITLTAIWIKVQEWWAYLWNRKGWIIAIAFLFAVGGYLKVKLARPVYSATLTFSLEQGGGKSSLSGLASQFGFSMDGDGGTFMGDNLLSIMKSRRLIDDVLLSPIIVGGDSVLLINQFVHTNEDLKEEWDSLGIYPVRIGVRPNTRTDSAFGAIHEYLVEEALSVSKADEELSIVTLSQWSHDPYFSKNFVELLGQKATEFYIESKTANNRANIAKLQRRVDSVTSELEVAMVSAGRANDANMFTVQSAAKVSSLEKQMKVTMLTTLYGELVKNLELSKTLAAREEPLITVIDRPHYPLRVWESGLKGALFGGVLGGILTVLFFGGREFLRDLNKQAEEARRG
jgi:hypothetical protein